MKKRYFLLILIIAVLTLSFYARDKKKNIFTDKESIGSVKIRKLADKKLLFNFPSEGKEYLKFKVNNRLTIYFYPEKIFPTVRVYGYIRGGEIFDTKKQVSKLTALLLRDSDTRELSSKKINDILDFDASKLDFVPGRDFVKIDGKYLVKNEENFIKILSFFLGDAKFSQKKLEILKKRLKGEDKRNSEIPFFLAKKLFYRIIYGEHPYGYFFTLNGIDDVSLSDIEKFYKTFYTPERTILLFCGDVHPAQVLSYFKKYLSRGSFFKRKDIDFKIPEVKVKFHPGVYVCNRKDVTQSAIYFGRLIEIENLKELYGIALFNHILGGSSFASKYTQQVRDVEGLAYRVDSIFETDNLTGPLFLSRCRTRVESTVRAIDSMLWIQDGFVNRRITEHEFLIGKMGLSRGFIKNFNTIDNILNLIVKTLLVGRNLDFLWGFSKEVNSLTYSDLVNSAVKVVTPENFTYVIVGDMKKYEKKLSKFGKVIEIDSEGNILDRKLKK